MKFELTIIVLTYNHEKFIVNCLNGIFNQDITFKTEVIISDDFSSDDTNSLISDFIKSHKKKYITFNHLKSEKNLGPRINFNKVISHVKSKYVAICDGDDVWTSPIKIKQQHIELQSNNKLVLACHNYDFILKNNTLKNKKKYGRFIFRRNMIFGKNAVNVQPSTVFFRFYSDVFSNSSLKSNGFNYDFSRLLSKGDGLYLESTFCNYRINENGMYYSKGAVKRLEIALTNQIQIYFDKNFTDNKVRKYVLFNSIYLISHTIFFLLIKFQFNQFFNCIKMLNNINYKP
jgi:glycosyltransferase involved in cell wall biosynthesis